MRPEDLKIENCWEAFATATLPEYATSAQYHAMRHAFLAGISTTVQYVQALQQHAPTNIKSGVEMWERQSREALQEIGAGA